MMNKMLGIRSLSLSEYWLPIRAGPVEGADITASWKKVRRM
jgi:hypothetical protein